MMRSWRCSRPYAPLTNVTTNQAHNIEDFYALFLKRVSKLRRTEYGGFSTMPLAGSKVLLFDGAIHTTWLK